VVSPRSGQPAQGRAVRFHGKDLVIALIQADERDRVAARRPDGEVIVLSGQDRDGTALDAHNPKSLTFATKRPEHELLAIRGHRWKPVVVRSRSNLVKSRA